MDAALVALVVLTTGALVLALVVAALRAMWQGGLIVAGIVGVAVCVFVPVYRYVLRNVVDHD
jgi:hypothetical protein